MSVPTTPSVKSLLLLKANIEGRTIASIAPRPRHRYLGIWERWGQDGNCLPWDLKAVSREGRSPCPTPASGIDQGL